MSAAMNGQTNGASQVPEGWLSANDLQKRFGGSVRTLHRWGEEGRVGKVKDSNGRAWFSPEDYERALLAERDVEPDQAVQLEVRRTAVMVDGSNDLLRLALLHIERMAKPTADATLDVFELLRDENKALREQVAELTKVHLENMQAREKLLSEAHVRDLELKQLEMREARKLATLEVVKGPAQKLLAKLAGLPAGADTLPAPAPGRIAPARALFASLTDEQVSLLLSADAVREALTMLLETELLSAEQKGFVREALV